MGHLGRRHIIATLLVRGTQYYVPGGDCDLPVLVYMASTAAPLAFRSCCECPESSTQDPIERHSSRTRSTNTALAASYMHVPASPYHHPAIDSSSGHRTRLGIACIYMCRLVDSSSCFISFNETKLSVPFLSWNQQRFLRYLLFTIYLYIIASQHIRSGNFLFARLPQFDRQCNAVAKHPKLKP